MAFVIVSAGHLTDSPLRTLRARPVLAVEAAATLLLMTACMAIGFRLAQLAAPTAPAPVPPLDQPALHALVNRGNDQADKRTSAGRGKNGRFLHHCFRLAP